MRLCTGDAQRLAAALREAADQVDELARLAREEQDRREKARQWQREQEDEDFLDQVGDFIFGEDDLPPVPDPVTPPTYTSPAPISASRRLRPRWARVRRGPTTWTTSPAAAARPTTSCARHAARLRAAYTEFQAGTRWGHFDATSLITAFGRYIDLNEMDARWVAQIAAAFRAAGGDGAI